MIEIRIAHTFGQTQTGNGPREASEVLGIFCIVVLVYGYRHTLSKILQV